MRELTAWFAVIADDLPRPPGVEPEDKDVNALVVIAVVVVILGGVVLIAWLLKPLVVRRLAAEDVVETTTEPEGAELLSGWEDAWSDIRRGAETDARPSDITPETEPSVQEVVTEATIKIAPATEDEAAAPPEGPVETPSVEVSAEEPPSEPPVSPAAPVHEVDTEAIVGITLTVRELLDHANDGQFLRGFALYSEAFLARFRADTGLSDEEFAATFGSVPPAPPEARAELAAVSEVELLPDGRVRAVIAYSDGGAAPPPERFTFVRAATGDRWLIDDIAAAE